MAVEGGSGVVNDISPYVRGHRQRVARVRRARLIRFQRAKEQAEAMAIALSHRFPGVRVWLFGSLLHAERFDERSDIDLACEGLPAPAYLEACNMLEGIGEIPFDLVRVETCPDELAARIRREGRLIHGRP